MLPGLREEIVTSRHMTPEHFQHDLCSTYGAGFSLSPSLFQSAWFRPHNVSEEVEGLYLVGAGTHPGAGVPGVVASAKVVDKLLTPRPGTPHSDDQLPGEIAIAPPR